MPELDLSKIDVEDFLEQLGLRNITQATEAEIKFSCPYPKHTHGDESPSAFMNTGEFEPWKATQWFCHGCHESGNAVSLTMYMFDITRLKARRFLREAYDPASYDPDAISVVKEIDRYRQMRDRQREVTFDLELPEETMHDYLVDWDRVFMSRDAGEDIPEPLEYIIDRGFSGETLSEWEFGFDPMSNRIVFPVRDHEGKLVGFKGRAWREGHQPKYLVLGDRPGRPARYDFPCYHTSSVVFGLHKAKEWGDGHLIVCEGELNAIALWEKGFENAVAINGSNLSDRQASLLRRHADTLTIFFDSDNAGTNGLEIVTDALKDFVRLRVVPEHEGDPADMDHDEIAKCIEEARGSAQLRVVRSHQ